MITVQTLQLLLFLIPGLIASRVYDSLVVRGESKQHGAIIEALIFSMIIYTVFSFFPGAPPVSFNSTTFAINYSPLAFCALLSLATAVPALLAFLSFRGWFLYIARRLGITKKTTGSSTWNDVFNRFDTWITIHFKDGSRIVGYPRFFSDRPGEPCLFLTHPSWLEEKKGKTRYVPLDVEGVLITPEMPIEYIYFMKEKLP